MRCPRKRVTEKRTEKGLRVGAVVLGTTSGERKEEGTHPLSASLLLCKPQSWQVGFLGGEGLFSSFRLNSKTQQAATVPKPCLSTLAPAQGFPAGSELCNYPYNNYTWQKALTFLGEGFPATSSLFYLALDLHRINQQPGEKGAQAACSGGRWAPVR